MVIDILDIFALLNRSVCRKPWQNLVIVIEYTILKNSFLRHKYGIILLWLDRRENPWLMELKKRIEIAKKTIANYLISSKFNPFRNHPFQSEFLINFYRQETSILLKFSTC